MRLVETPRSITTTHKVTLFKTWGKEKDYNVTFLYMTDSVSFSMNYQLRLMVWCVVSAYLFMFLECGLKGQHGIGCKAVLSMWGINKSVVNVDIKL